MFVARLSISLLIVVVSLFFCSSSVSGKESAATNKTQQVRFYNFDDMLIDGEIKKPTGLLFDEHAKVKFNRFQIGKKSFLEKLKLTAQEKTFK